MAAPRALITGISGQDGSYLAEFLLGKGYEVFGIVRGSPTARYPNLDAVRHGVTLLQGDLLDQMTLLEAINTAQPDELYNLAATSFVPASWHQPVMTAQFTAVGVTAMLEAIRITNPTLRLYQASSSEMFGNAPEWPQSETTAFRPHTPYGVAKLYGYLMLVAYRERHGMHLSSGIAFNHESPRRPPEFVTRKVTRAAAAVALGLQQEVRLGDLSARRDWGFAGDYVEAMWLMLQQDRGDDYVLATGQSRTVAELVDVAFAYVGHRPEDHVVVDSEYVRPPEPVPLIGDPTKARMRLGWSARTTFDEMIGAMVETDLASLQRESSEWNSPR
jgi:GDPmannose 4,6-dehydratase